MKRLVLSVVMLLIAFPVLSRAGVYAKGSGGGGGSDATEHSVTVTRPLNQTDTFAVGTHGTPEITLDPVAKVIDIIAGLTGQCNTLKEALASGANKQTSCVADALTTDYACAFEDGEWMGAGCPAPLGYAEFQLSADDTIPTNPVTAVHPTWTLSDSGGAAIDLFPSVANYVRLKKDGVYEVNATLFGVISIASTATSMIPSILNRDASVAILEASYNPDPGFPITSGTTVSDATTILFHALLQVTGVNANSAFALKSNHYSTGSAEDVNIFVKPNTDHAFPVTVMFVKKLR